MQEPSGKRTMQESRGDKVTSQHNEGLGKTRKNNAGIESNKTMQESNGDEITS